jgi:hypothetical protein
MRIVVVFSEPISKENTFAYIEPQTLVRTGTEYHRVITVDSEKERVASEVIDFLSALRSSAEPAGAMG